jgi:hypothetical protein
MTIKNLQAKLAKAEAEIKGLRIFKELLDNRADTNDMLMGWIHQYNCKICGLIHFPEPLTKCPRENDNKEQIAQEKRVRERYFNEFSALVKRCTDEHGKVQWKYVDRSFRGNERVTMIALNPRRRRKMRA